MGIEEQFILLSLGLVTIGVRMGVRIRQIGFGEWQLDDYLMPITGVSGAITCRCTGPFADLTVCLTAYFHCRDSRGVSRRCQVPGLDE
jgi:hypothetical protein